MATNRDQASTDWDEICTVPVHLIATRLGQLERMARRNGITTAQALAGFVSRGLDEDLVSHIRRHG